LTTGGGEKEGKHFGSAKERKDYLHDPKSNKKDVPSGLARGGAGEGGTRPSGGSKEKETPGRKRGHDCFRRKKVSKKKKIGEGDGLTAEI